MVVIKQIIREHVKTTSMYGGGGGGGLILIILPKIITYLSSTKSTNFYH